MSAARRRGKSFLAIRRIEAGVPLLAPRARGTRGEPVTRKLLAMLPLIALVAAAPAHAQTHDQNWTACAGQQISIDLAITACSTIIQSGSATTENRAIALNNRGGAYNSK